MTQFWPAILVGVLGTVHGIALSLLALVIVDRRKGSYRCTDSSHLHGRARTIRGELVVVCYPAATIDDLTYRMRRWVQDTGYSSAYALDALAQRTGRVKL